MIVFLHNNDLNWQAADCEQCCAARHPTAFFSRFSLPHSRRHAGHTTLYFYCIFPTNATRNVQNVPSARHHGRPVIATRLIPSIRSGSLTVWQANRRATAANAIVNSNAHPPSATHTQAHERGLGLGFGFGVTAHTHAHERTGALKNQSKKVNFP